jgi:uncharacterized protein (DUF2336 family)
MTAHPLDFEDAYARTKSLSSTRQDLVNQYEEVIRAAADAQQDYRRALALAHVQAAGDSELRTAAMREARAKELASDAERASAIADGVVKATLERIRACEADRAMLNTLVGWSVRLTPMGHSDPNPQSTPRRA